LAASDCRWYAADEMMHAILLNIRHGGGRRTLEWLAERSPDVITLPEWCSNAPGAVLKAGLEARGFQIATATTNGANGVLFAAKRPFSFRCATPPDAANGALLVADFGSLRILAAYFPQRKAKAPFFRFCAAEAEASHSIPFLLLGDLNTGRNDIDKETNGARFDCVDQFKALPLVDLWRVEHGDAARDWTWFSRKSAKCRSNGFRIDHAFANAAFRKHFPIIRCFYDHAPREMNLTDHSALVLSGSEADIG
jgi:exodeoxyribonuclease III